MVDADNFSFFFAGKFSDKLTVYVEDSCWECRVKLCEVFVVYYEFCI